MRTTSRRCPASQAAPSLAAWLRARRAARGALTRVRGAIRPHAGYSVAPRRLRRDMARRRARARRAASGATPPPSTCALGS